MERITNPNDTLCMQCANEACKMKQFMWHRETCKVKTMYDRLQAYENLGYTPEELKAMLEERK